MAKTVTGLPGERRIADAAALRNALRAFLRSSEAVVRGHGLTPEQYELLLLIRNAPGRQTTIRDLQLALDRRQSAVTQLARRAENLGLISRRLSSDDARVRYLELTADGERALLQAVAGLGPERARLLRILRALAD